MQRLIPIFWGCNFHMNDGAMALQDYSVINLDIG